VRPVIDVRHHRLSVSLPPTARLVADPVRLEQILSNLLSNAAKYTEPGGRIDLVARRHGADVRIAVRDSGIGISPEMLSRIFDLFMQGERSPECAQGGLGIGLTLVRRLVEMHGGTVHAQSGGPGQGSEFEIRLPAEGRASAETPAPAIRRPAENENTVRLLIVDDNTDSVALLKEAFSSWGHAVAIAHDGPAALSEAPQFRPDVVLLDIGLPGMDGYELARRLRERDDLKDATLIALSGYGQPGDRERSRRAGFTAHLVKPVDLATLRHMVTTAR
jgi:CheY-like chemotaxis protein